MATIQYDAVSSEYELEVEFDRSGNLESIKLAGSAKCLIDLLSPATVRDIENEALSHLKFENEQNRVSDLVAA